MYVTSLDLLDYSMKLVIFMKVRIYKIDILSL